MIKINEQEFVKVCSESKTMLEASKKLDLHFNTFVRYAKRFGCYNPNQSGKGCKKERKRVSLDLIFSNIITYQTFKLKLRLFNDKLKFNRCEKCGLDSWLDDNLNCELHHIDGNSHNNAFSNLLVLCPNCHSQTNNFRAKNINLSST